MKRQYISPKSLIFQAKDMRILAASPQPFVADTKRQNPVVAVPFEKDDDLKDVEQEEEAEADTFKLPSPINVWE